MAYCTQDDILNQISEDDLIQLTDDDDAGEVDTDKVSRAIDDAEALIDSYCGTKYLVPFSTVPDIIRSQAVEIAIYDLFARRMGAPEERKQRYDDAIRFLKDVAGGKASLGVQPPPDPPGDDNYTGGSQVSVRTKIFDSDTMDKY